MVQIQYCRQGTPNSPEVHKYKSENECAHRYMARNTLPIHSIVSSILLIWLRIVEIILCKWYRSKHAGHMRVDLYGKWIRLGCPRTPGDTLDMI